MHFPYEFSCIVSRGRYDQPQMRKCTLGPLWMTIAGGSATQQFSFMELQYIGVDNDTNSIELAMRRSRRDKIKLTFNDHVELRVCDSYLTRVIPAENYTNCYKNQEVFGLFTSEKQKTFTAVHKETKKPVLVRQMPLIGSNSLLELELAMTLINKCTPKPIRVFIEKSSLKFVYEFFAGCTLAKKMALQTVHKESDIRSFVVRIMFFLIDIEEKDVELSSLDACDVLLSEQDIRKPHIINLSSTYKYPSQHQPKHSRFIGEILFAMVMLTPFSESEHLRLKQWYHSLGYNYCPALRTYDRGLFDLILQMLEGDKKADDLMKIPWLRYNTERKPIARLFTIESSRQNFSTEQVTHQSEVSACSEEYESEEEDLVEQICQKLRLHQTTVNQLVRSHSLNRSIAIKRR